MRRLLKIVLLLAAVGLVVAGVSLFSVYEASQMVPSFYKEAVAMPPVVQEEARDEFVAQATALASELQEPGQWQGLFTADQINAWLALELSTNYPDMLPPELHDPRVSISKNEATVACRWQDGEISTVLSLTLDVYVHEPGVLALRIRRARAGALPVPLAQVLDTISHAAHELDLRLEWRKAHGDPVALVTFPQLRGSRVENLHVQTVELRDGELFVAGIIGNGPLASLIPRPSEKSPTTPGAENDPGNSSAEKATPQVGAADSTIR